MSYIGPQLPPSLAVGNPEESEQSAYGPSLPPHLIQQKRTTVDDADIIGPLPADAPMSESQLQLEERAYILKTKFLEKANEKKEEEREAWMVELPPEKASFGMGSRTFRKNVSGDKSNRSLWTATPNDAKKETAADLKIMNFEQITVTLRDKRMEEQLQTIKKKKRKKDKKSLLEIHRKKMKKEKELKKTEERRPFDREIDLQVNKFDEAKKKAAMSKAKFLDSRFSQGSSKFL